MPLIKSAINEMRKDKKKTSRNRVRKEQMQAAIKAVAKLTKEKDATGIPEAVKKAQKAIDKATKRNLLHKKTASRRKAQVVKLAKAATKK